MYRLYTKVKAAMTFIKPLAYGSQFTWYDKLFTCNHANVTRKCHYTHKEYYNCWHCWTIVELLRTLQLDHITAGRANHYSCDNLSLEVPTTLMGASRLGMVEVSYTPWYGCYDTYSTVQPQVQKKPVCT